jgi:hypothetical protein
MLDMCEAIFTLLEEVHDQPFTHVRRYATLVAASR